MFNFDPHNFHDGDASDMARHLAKLPTPKLAAMLGLLADATDYTPRVIREMIRNIIDQRAVAAA